MRHTTSRRSVGTALVAAAVGLVPAVAAVSTAAAAEPVVVYSHDFEDGTAGSWTGRNATVEVIDTDGHESAGSLLVSGRTAGWNGAQLAVGSLVTEGTYEIEAWVKLAPGSDPAGVNLGMQQPGASNEYPWVGGRPTVTADDWTLLSGSYTVDPATPPTILYVESASETADILLDDVTITGTPPAPAVTTVWLLDFDDEVIAPWNNNGGTHAFVDDGQGGLALSVTRSNDWEGIKSPAGVLEHGVEYTFSMRARLAEGTADAEMRFVVEPQYTWVANTTVTADGWTEITGTYILPADVDPAAAAIFIGSANQTEPYTYIIDDVLITQPDSGPGGFTPVDLEFDFEDGTLQGWVPRDSGPGAPTVVVTDAEAHESTHAALVTDRIDQGSGIGYDLTGVFETGVTYNITAWVKMAEGVAADDIWLSAQTGPNDFSTVGQFPGIGSGEWTQVSASFTMPSAGMAFLYFETSYSSGSNGDFLVDDITITSQEPSVIEDLTPIKDTVDFPVGVAIDERETLGSAADLTLLHFDQVTPENHMKPEAWYDEAGTFGIHPQATAIMDFASANDLAVYGHVLFWHSQTPEWFFQNDAGEPLTDSAADQQILRDRMETHVFAIAEALSQAYGLFGSDTNPLNAWDVVNEVVSDSGEFSDGLRRSEYYRILGEGYIDLAFELADAAFNDVYADPAADRPVTLFINDYNTEQGGKQQRYYDLVTRLLDRGVPVDGVGHQFHVSLSMPVSALEAAIVRFADLPVTQAVTELDVTVGTPVTTANLIEQGYYYRDAFRVFREYAGELHAVTIWGLTDARSWRSAQAPVVFDAQLQAKPAYYGIVDGELDPRVRTAFVFSGDVPIDAGALDAIEWSNLPLHAVEGVAGFQLRWQPDHLTVYVNVDDATVDPSDAVVLTYGDQSVTVNRSDADTTTQVVSPTAEGWELVIQLPLAEPAAEGDQMPFNVEVTDGAATVSWGDGGAAGTLTLVEELSYVEIPQAPAAPTVDGEVDDMWALANPVTTDTVIQSSEGIDATAEVRTLWLDDTLYVLAQVTDDQIDVSGSDPWVQDSVEVFVDAGNYRNGPYRYDDTQIRINAENTVSFGTGDEAFQEARLTSATSIVEGGYIVEAAIDLLEEGGVGTFHGLDFQVNDGTDGVRTAIRTWADPTGLSYQSTARWGVGQLVAGEEPPVLDPMIELGSRLVNAGGTLAIDLSGYAPGSTVVIQLERWRGPWSTHGQPVVLDEVTVDADGTASVEVTIPRGTKVGIHMVAAVAGDLRAVERVIVLPSHERGQGR